MDRLKLIINSKKLSNRIIESNYRFKAAVTTDSGASHADNHVHLGQRTNLEEVHLEDVDQL